MSTTSSKEPSLVAPQPSDSKKGMWSPLSTILIVVLSFFTAQVLGVLILSIYPRILGWNSAEANKWLNNSIAAQFIFVLISEAITIIVLWLFIRHRITKKQLGLSHPKWVDAIYAIGGIAAYFVFYILVVSTVSAVVHINTNQQQDIGFNNVTGIGALIMTFISLVILPPIVEEITFRGFLFGGLRRRYKFIWAALGTSILFSIPHLLESDSGQGLLWIAGIDTFVLSMVLCYLREKSGRLWASMLVHAAKNSIAFISLFIVHVH